MDELEKLKQENAQLRLVLSHARAELNARSWPDYYLDSEDDRLDDEMDALGIQDVAMEPLPVKEIVWTPEEIAERERIKAEMYKNAIFVRITRDDILSDDLSPFTPSVRLRQSPSS